MKVAVTPALLSFLRDRRIYTSSSDRERLKPGDDLRLFPDSAIEPYAHILGGARIPAAIGAFSYSFSPLDTAMRIGRYCSISWGVSVMGSAHTSDWVTTHPLSHNPGPLPGIKAYLVERGVTSYPLLRFDQGAQQVELGHDVWIGAEAMLKRDIVLGAGCVVGARSLVTHDVPPYAIVGGVPAKVIRYRFDEQLIARLLASRWWDYGPDVLHQADMREPERFLDRLAETIATGKQPMELTPVRGQEIIDAAGPQRQ